MLFSLFQSAKPKTGLFCFLITEARVTTALEMPDHENAFVLKVMLPLSHLIIPPPLKKLKGHIALGLSFLSFCPSVCASITKIKLWF